MCGAMFLVITIFLLGLAPKSLVLTEDQIAVMPTITDLCSFAYGHKFLRPGSCAQWIKCPSTSQSNDFEEGSCVGGMHFDVQTQRCVAADTIFCPYKEFETVEHNSNPNSNSNNNMNMNMNNQVNNNPISDAHVWPILNLVNELPEVSPRGEPECLPDRQSYHSDPSDCSKYYICITGKAILTTCPEGLLWHSSAQFCDVPANVQCDGYINILLYDQPNN